MTTSSVDEDMEELQLSYNANEDEKWHSYAKIQFVS